MQEEFLRTPIRAQGLIQVDSMNETTRQLKHRLSKNNNFEWFVFQRDFCLLFKILQQLFDFRKL